MRDEKLYGKVVKWDEIPEEEVRRGVRRRIYATDAVMLAMNIVVAGMEPKPHAHADFDQLVYIAEGSCRYHVDDVAHEMPAGSLLLVPAGAEHFIEPLSSPCVNLDIFVPPRADYADSLAWIATLSDDGR